MHLVPQTLRYNIWLCSSLTKLKTSSIEYVLMILVGSYTQCVTGVLSPQKQLQSENLAKQFNTLSYIQLYQNASIWEMIPAESQKIPTESQNKERGFWKQNPLLRLKILSCNLISTFSGVYV